MRWSVSRWDERRRPRLLIEKTRYGLIIRAGSRDPEIVKVLGVDVAKVWLLVFGVGTAIAGLLGVLK